MSIHFSFNIIYTYVVCNLSLKGLFVNVFDKIVCFLLSLRLMKLLVKLTMDLVMALIVIHTQDT